MHDKAFYLTKLEFSLLLAAEGVDQLYCFDLYKSADVTEEMLIQAANNIILNGWGAFSEKRLISQGEMKGLIEQTARAEKIISIGVNGKYRWLCYISDEVITVSLDSSRMFRIQRMEETAFLHWLSEDVLRSEPYWKLDADAQAAVYRNEITIQEKEMIEAGAYEKLRQDLSADIRDFGGNILKKYVFLHGMLNLWIVCMDADGRILEIEPDSAELRTKIWTDWRKRQDDIG